jgi:uncharacterized Zn finger protein (UPF0148 family)
MWQDCDRCGVFAQCDKEGICPDCREEENGEEEETEEVQAQTPNSSSRSATQDKEGLQESQEGGVS